MKLKWVSLGAGALLFTVSCGNRQQDTTSETPRVYSTMVISQQDATLESTYPVNVEGVEDIEVRPRIDGFIEAIYVDEGATVKKGQALFKINSPSAEQSYRTAQASVVSAQAQLNTAQLNRDRFQPLVEKNIVSQVQYDTYVNAYEVAQATLAQAEASLRNAEATLSWTTVTSPVDGRIGEIPYRLGSLVSSSNVLTTVANTGNVYAYFSLNEKDLLALLDRLEGNTQAEKIKNLPEVTLIMKNGDTYAYKGRVNAIPGLANVTTGSLRLRAEFPNPEGVLRSGFSGNIIIPRHIENAYVIPQAATYMQQNKTLAYKVQGDSVKSVLISVLPLPDGKHYVVTDGLTSGDKIITDGLVTIKDGDKIAEK